MATSGGINQLGSDPHPVSGLANTALHYIAHPQILTHLLDLYRLALVGKRRVSGNHKHLVDLGEGRDDFLG